MADEREERDEVEAAVAAHYAQQQAGLPPPLEPHPGYPSLGAAWVAHRRWLSEEHRAGRLPVRVPPAVRPD